MLTGAPILESVSHLTCKDYGNHSIWGLCGNDFLMAVKILAPHVLALAGMSILSMLLVLWGFENILCLWHSESDVFQTVISKSWWPGQGCTFSSVPFSLTPSKSGRSVAVCCGCLLTHMLNVMVFFLLQYVESIFCLKTTRDWNSSLNPLILKIKVTKSQLLIGKDIQRHKEKNIKSS